MIATVTANPCLDKTVTVPQFDLYRMNRVRVLCTDPSGKGINVSKTLAAMGAQTLCVGFDFTDGTPSPLRTDLDACGIPYELIPVSGALRVCTKIIDESRKHTIEVNEQGAAVTCKDGIKLRQKIEEVAGRCSFLTLSGSLPQGLDPHFYATCAKAIRTNAPACRLVLDAEGEQLRNALCEGAYLIKPNIHEFSATFDKHPVSVRELDKAVQEVLAAYPVEVVCVSLGGDGAYIGTRNEAYFCPPLRVKARSLQGAGDAMVAGLCMAMERDLPLADVLCHGVCLATATIMTEGTRPGSRADFERFLKAAPDREKLR